MQVNVQSNRNWPAKRFQGEFQNFLSNLSICGRHHNGYSLKQVDIIYGLLKEY